MRRRWAFLELLVTLALLAIAKVSVAAGPPVAANVSSLRDQVAAAVARDLRSGLTGETDGSNLQVLNPSLSLPPSSHLHVASVRAGYSPGSWLLRLDCSSRRDCLPFHVLLRASATDLRGNLGAGLTAKLPGKGGPGQMQPKSPVAHSGDHVLLVEERSGLRLKVMAVCLQSGGLGDEIRVRNLATHRVLLATVAGKDLVRVE